MKVGIIGLANVGKSSLFQVLTKKQVNISNYPFATIDPNVAVMSVKNDQLTQIAKIMRSAEIFPATIEITDIAGLIKGSHTGEGLGNQFLSYIRPMNLLLHVVRVFGDKQVIRNEGPINPGLDIKIIQEELRLKDEQKQEKILSTKPLVYVFNTSDKDDASQKLKEQFKPYIAINVKQELEAATLSSEEQNVLGFSPQIPRLIKLLYTSLNLITFFTANKNEARAHIVTRGITAQDAAAVVHSDFQEKFIRADTLNWRDLIKTGSLQTAKEKGLVRSQSKEYIIQDGDVIEFKI